MARKSIPAIITFEDETMVPPEPPLGIWGPTDPRPGHPIVLPPGPIQGPVFPVQPLPIPPGWNLHPSHPIYVPIVPPDAPVAQPPIYIPVPDCEYVAHYQSEQAG
jgi:hypothetical protein